MFALHESGPGAPEMAWPEPPTPGAISWHELLTDDFEVALSFYAVLFGWERAESMEHGPAGTYQMYGKDGRTLGGMMNRPEDMPAPPHWLLYTYVGDLDAALAEGSDARRLGPERSDGDPGRRPCGAVPRRAGRRVRAPR